MRKRAHTEEEIRNILREAEISVGTKEVIARHGITARTLYRWKAKYGGDAGKGPEMRKFREENALLRAIVASQVLEIQTLKQRLERGHAHGGRHRPLR